MKRLLLVFVVLLVLMVGCGNEEIKTAVPTPIPESVNPTSIPPSPTDTLEPTAVPPTDTPLPPTEEPETIDFAALEQDLQVRVIDEQVKAGFPGVILSVDAPDLGFSWQGAGGMADVAAGIPMEPDTPFRLASISKMMTAVVVLRLAEEGFLDLDDPISQYLDSTITDQLNGPDGKPYGEMITIRQLLNHTSGVATFFFTEDRDRNGADDFVDIIINDPEKMWTPVEAVAHVTNTMEPQFEPGKRWRYSDTNFILAGLIVEAVTGESLSDAYQDWLFTPLGMTETFLAQVGDPRLENVAHVYYDDLDVSDYASLSWQWGTAGVVSTADDLNRFMWAWVHDEIFTDPASKEAMTQWTNASALASGLSYGLGIFDVDFEKFIGARKIGEVMGHNSLWNGFVYYWPDHNLVISGTLNQVNPSSRFIEPVYMTFQTILAHVETE